MHLIAVPALSDNYIWLLCDETGSTLIVDPGEDTPVINYLHQHQLIPQAILLTHHHHDHVGGVAGILRHYPAIRVYGPTETASKGANTLVAAGDQVPFAGHLFEVIATPGHTLGHVSYFSSPYLFCGDTMFSGGCGRLFEGTAKQMYQSFQLINQLPPDTLICCAHEYTLSNMTFAKAIWPENKEISDYYDEINAMRAENKITLPTTLQHERQINVFLMSQQIEIKNKLNLNSPNNTPEQVFAALRTKKDFF
ncbi:hydroxyacylglutathione hydrolase [Erwinia sp. OLTSP20]|uniref:hydroxyacylglutathione hydrolase n=1 Tax=unclassified Erwinia TaxID=2622719 RepID=UPI000C1A5366|nr:MULTISPECIES: hydroxyacylglutathione hydrolase [unclassified Erwinia]PIJ48398.1 hydroxyacylglutathione hydrolase [Erwinia sp. OAMSP11]PIJ67736.1 hydroxyacylglutathione hydrolase [Erwinia sp. OLSSP12]PIJ78759.1 hydroxyacylglutathione hydrolase [Erwinia sp. OLCASP19]PIJ79419.1 hydroxyacylglutathione hydrolase [Erwinia sp. OLMTSP26]PIJ81290.1 hydroxyacylglutathione hydrolase [Erwinia sp. OLMDSP33]